MDSSAIADLATLQGDAHVRLTARSPATRSRPVSTSSFRTEAPPTGTADLGRRRHALIHLCGAPGFCMTGCPALIERENPNGIRKDSFYEGNTGWGIGGGSAARRAGTSTGGTHDRHRRRQPAPGPARSRPTPTLTNPTSTATDDTIVVADEDTTT